MFYNCKKRYYTAVLPLLVFAVSSFTIPAALEEYQWLENCFKSRFDASRETGKLKKWDLSITDKGFFRLRKFYNTGKQEYFSFHLQRFEDMDYLGTADRGDIVLKTRKDDIIVQTYNDPRGNIDSMASSLRIPAINVQPEMLDSLLQKLSLEHN